nr:2173_t:CDS:2 [Entrophospora candida]CAG8461997.1 1203_t:CDS:2 [Entrophospora candida]
MTIVNNHTDQTASSLLKSDPKLSSGEVKVDTNKYGKLATEETIAKTKGALETKGHQVTVLNTSEEAYEFLKKLIPANASVNNGHSTTLEEIGFIEYLKTAKEWVNIHAEILAEKDFAKQSEIRRLKGYNVDYYLSSASAITEDGVIIGVDASGSRVAAWVDTAKTLVIVSGTNKIVKDANEAEERVTKYSFELESARARLAYGVPGSQISNYVSIRSANPFSPTKRVHVVLIKEVLGY